MHDDFSQVLIWIHQGDLVGRMAIGAHAREASPREFRHAWQMYGRTWKSRDGHNRTWRRKAWTKEKTGG